MNTRRVRRSLVVLAHAAVGWAFCFATMGIGLAVSTLQPTLVVHAIGAPIYFFGVSMVYFKRFGYTSPLQTALAFTGFVVGIDFLMVALVINRSLAMFASPLGTWIPFALIFTSTWVTGLLVIGRASMAGTRKAGAHVIGGLHRPGRRPGNG
jgi:hypothetical protein